ncbi:amidohydrolase family protein [Sphaerisporangium viridialbum]|uniref:amidohydrolase family protein n=1 Tax=Sphaerisporangium viridialbum TaxID=46189 RepID=UPI003C75AF87
MRTAARDRADGGGPATRIRAEWLYRGAGVAQRGAAILIRGERIVMVGPDARVPSADGPEFTFAAATVLPGLIDAHTHLLLPHGGDLTWAGSGPADAAATTAAASAARSIAGRLLESGVTTVRDLGSPGTLGQALRDAVDADQTAGPTIVAAGRPITSPDGHFRSFGITVQGADQAARAVERLHGEGADLVKVAVTGGSLTPGTDMGRAYLGRAEVAAVVAAAHDRGMRVAAHAHGTAGVEVSLAAGVDSIEHCTWLDADGRVQSPPPVLVRALRDRRRSVVLAGPIEPAIADVLDIAAGPDPRVSPGVDRRIQIWRNGRTLARAGVPVALGSDSMYGQFPGYRDLTIRARAMVAFAGWQPAEMLAALTTGGAHALGRLGEVGMLAAGAYADLLVVSGNPTESIDDLDRVVAVFKRGRRVIPGEPAGD